MIRFTLCFIFLYDLLGLTVGHGHVGLADMIFKTIEECEEPTHKVEFLVSQKKFNRTTNVLDITVNTPIDIDDNVTIELNGSIMKEGGYKPGSFYLKDAACKTLTLMLGDMFINILHAAGVDECPLPAGNWGASDFYFDNTKFTVPQVFGEYKMEILIAQGDELLSCNYAYYDLLPKEE